MMEDVNCPLCGSGKSALVFRAADRLRLAAGTFDVVRCADCGTGYLNPRPSVEELASCYPRTYWGERQGGAREFLRGFEERFKESYKVSALARAGLSGGRVLDVGCGRGEFLAILRARGFEVFGLEPGEEAARRGRGEYGLDITCGLLGEVDLPEAGYDAVTLWHVLEHLPDPRGALGHISRALRPGGLVFIAVPDFGSWQAGVFGPDWFCVDAPRHLTHFTKGTLASMLDRSGFSTPEFHTGGPRYETAVLVRSLLPGLNFRKLDALEAGRPSRYAYKAVQLALDIGLLPVGLASVLAGRGSTFTAVARKAGQP